MTNLNVMQWGDSHANKVVVGLHGITANAGAMSEPAKTTGIP